MSIEAAMDMVEAEDVAGEMVTVAKFLEPTEAQMAMGMLQSAGIECLLVGENANNLLALAFRVRLQVRRDDEPAALSMLQSAGAPEESPQE